MSLKSAVIAAAALAVVGFALYLFVQVRATPAAAHVVVTEPPPVPQARTPQPAPPTPTPPPPPKGNLPTNAKEVTALWQKGQPPQPGREVDGPPPPSNLDPDHINVKLDSMMELANKAYDTQDFDQATAIAGKVLSKDPNNVRMLRILVSANCIQGDSAVAQQYYEKLPPGDREQMRARCDRYGVVFKDPPQ